ncbi:SCO family protein [Pseudonocardia eucalypti]|uniref:SCO family protein n=1 Tax=Pseudonocardia eucalypti TaxID=648755 RepID=A0ABP9RBF1_9PSEU|nr:protein SCO1/2 [Pseudonocardia eucalypti]
MAPHPVGARFDLIDHHGNPVTNDTYRGRHPLVFFGFTHCAVVCPRALGKLSAALDELGELRERLVPLYVTVDPERDDPDRMREFLETNYPLFTGLTGSPEALADARREFRVFAVRKQDPDAEGGYQVPHSAITYLLDTDGTYLAHFTDALDASEVARRLTGVLNPGG